MKLINDPTKYGYESELGLFLSIDELQELGVLHDLKKKIHARLITASKKYEKYNSMQQMGEATTSQQNAMMKWEEKMDNYQFYIDSIEDTECTISRINEKKKQL